MYVHVYILLLCLFMFNNYTYKMCMYTCICNRNGKRVQPVEQARPGNESEEELQLKLALQLSCILFSLQIVFPKMHKGKYSQVVRDTNVPTR